MAAELHRIGEGRHRVAVIDGLVGDLGAVIDMAAALAPYPAAVNRYPGVRRVIARHEPADRYVCELMNAAAPYIAGALDREKFRVVEASFSMVTRAPGDLSPEQRAPHFDSTDPDLIAVLHYLSVPGGGGTAFYRHRSTGIEQMTEANVDRFVAAATREGRKRPEPAGYVGDDDPHFEQLLAIPAASGRTLIYQGSLLHSGVITPDTPLSPDPRIGRLTGNFFIQLEGGGR